MMTRHMLAWCVLALAIAGGPVGAHIKLGGEGACEQEHETPSDAEVRGGGGGRGKHVRDNGARRGATATARAADGPTGTTQPQAFAGGLKAKRDVNPPLSGEITRASALKIERSTRIPQRSTLNVLLRCPLRIERELTSRSSLLSRGLSRFTVTFAGGETPELRTYERAPAPHRPQK